MSLSDNDKHSKNPESESHPANELFWRDEILQVVYWYCGEGLGKSIGLAELQTFLPAPENVMNRVLESMVTDGYLIKESAGSEEPRYSFTPLGSKEGARRFADEFAGLTGQAHGECNDPDCDCQTQGPAACSNRVATGSGAGHIH